MGCRILYDKDEDLACMYCSTSDFAFGPVFYKGEDGHDAQERLEAFYRWVDSERCPWRTFEQVDAVFVNHSRRDPRILTDHGLEAAYTAWLAQEADQWQREEKAEEVQS